MLFGSLTHLCRSKVLTSSKLLLNQLFLGTLGDRASYPFSEKCCFFLLWRQVEGELPPRWGQGGDTRYQLYVSLLSLPQPSKFCSLLHSSYPGTKSLCQTLMLEWPHFSVCLELAWFTPVFWELLFSKPSHAPKHSGFDSNKHTVLLPLTIAS